MTVVLRYNVITFRRITLTCLSLVLKEIYGSEFIGYLWRDTLKVPTRYKINGVRMSLQMVEER